MLQRYYDGEDIVDIIGTKDKQTPGKRYQVQMFMQNLFEFDSHDFIIVGQKCLKQNKSDILSNLFFRGVKPDR